MNWQNLYKPEVTIEVWVIDCVYYISDLWLEI